MFKATLPNDRDLLALHRQGARIERARHIAFRNITVLQKAPMSNPATAWSREVYLPAGTWRDFWTGKAFDGGQHHVVAATPQHPPVFVRDGTLLPLAEPLMAIDGKTVFTIHLAAYGDAARSCELLEDDGVTFDFEKGRWATVTARADGSTQRPDHGQPQRYQVTGKAQPPEPLLKRLLGVAE